MDDTSKGTPQFATAEFASNTSNGTCAGCKRPINGPYFTVNGARACADCTSKIQAQVPKDSHAAFMRALLFGAGGAVAGFALYVIVALETGLVMGIVSLAVGFIVGKAMSVGSGGVGGRRYQIAAVLLTYFAVSLSAVPIAIQQWRQHHEQQAAAVASAPSADAQAPAQKTQPNLAKALGVLVLLGLASPILALKDPAHGAIGLIILFVGMRFAWRFAAGRTLRVSGPYEPAPAGAV
jgi:hypothetical protein